LVNYRPPIGKLLLAECDGQPAGVGALHMLEAGTAEVKRMYVAPVWRNRRVGSTSSGPPGVSPHKTKNDGLRG
jgi:hypothetical protein